MKPFKILGHTLLLCAILSAFFTVLFYTDNKYSTPPPYGKDGVLMLARGDLERGSPIFLVDGWLLTDDRVTRQPTWIGEYTSLQRGEESRSPHGTASYQLTLHYSGAAMTVVVEFPELFSQYTLTRDGVVDAQGVGNGRLSFLLTQGDHVLTVETKSVVGYYSGMYYPPALGTPDVLARNQSLRTFAYALAFGVPLMLALFTLFLWQTGGAMARWFGLLCCFYALYVSYYFVQLFHLPGSQNWFVVEKLAFYGLCSCVVRLTALAAGPTPKKVQFWIRVGMFLLPCCALVLCLLIPILPWALTIHGMLTDLYYLGTFCCVVYFGGRGLARQGWEVRWTLVCCLVFGAGLLLNLFSSNHFEPIYFFWQFEWCGLLLVALFGARMVARNRSILTQNAELTQHLEQLVDKRTEELNRLLQERKAFFSDMAHDLKAPVFATQSFIAAIREGGVGVDGELSRYLNLAEGKQQEMVRRLQGLSEINALDRIEGERVPISIQALLEEVYAAHHAEAEVASVHFRVEFPKNDGVLIAQMEKLELIFENLIYNALRATSAEGNITVSAQVSSAMGYITVSDTGCGIEEEALPHIFQRFYVGQQNRDFGTGLGLYIVKTIIEELGGRISVSSIQGEGTTFTMELPLQGQPFAQVGSKATEWNGEREKNLFTDRT